MTRKRWKRHSGRKTVTEDDRHTTYYNEWKDWRDGFRTPFDNTKIRSEWCWFSDDVQKCNEKIKRLNLRHKLMKHNPVV